MAMTRSALTDTDVRTLVKDEMEHVIELNVPIVADVGVGENWRDLKG